AVANGGGILGVWYRQFDSMKGYVEGIKRRVDSCGVDHIGIGTDRNVDAMPYSKMWPDENGGFFYAFVAEMLKQGFMPDDISKIGGGNYWRVFAKITSAHSCA